MADHEPEDFTELMIDEWRKRLTHEWVSIDRSALNFLSDWALGDLIREGAAEQHRDDLNLYRLNPDHTPAKAAEAAAKRKANRLIAQNMTWAEHKALRSRQAWKNRIERLFGLFSRRAEKKQGGTGQLTVRKRDLIP
ncbi:hypothetical protein [Methylobacterium sp. GC_Met_2]|uniref:hypothetical protein n=1 Tax=Methylobacterium sp. GC_Met_2 TaxID=2937376 RepID=UPI00226B01A8|nr:hypothetical protein [Methylobacterium sp. GC_Met_2]